MTHPTTTDQGDERRAAMLNVIREVCAKHQFQSRDFADDMVSALSAAQPVAQEAIQPCAHHFVPWTGCASCERWKTYRAEQRRGGSFESWKLEKERNALAAPQPSQGAELSEEDVKHIIRTTPGPDGYRAALVRAGYALGVAATPHPPVSAEADRYKRALEAIIANPGGASAKRIATLALGLDGTEQVSAEAGKGARDPDAACAPCGLCHQLDGHALNCPNSPSESVAMSAAPMRQPEPTSKGATDDSAAVEWVSQWMGDFDVVLPNKAFKLLIRKVSSSQQREPQEAAERVYLVATGETHEGQETYTRHEVCPPLCDAETLYLRPSQQALSDAQRRVLDFLYGVGELEGCGFSEKPAGELGNFWWRKHLRSAFPDILAAAGGSEK